MGPIEIFMRLAGRFGFAFDGVDVEASTDQMIEKLENHREIGSDRVTAHETSIKRTPFTSDVPFRQKAMAYMGWRDFLELFPQGPRFIAHTNRGQKFWKETFEPTRREISDVERNDLVAFIKDKGALDVGFVPEVDPRLIFAGQVLPERHAIVFSVKMDKEAMETSPSAKSSTEVMRRYADLGAIAAATCEWLRERGFAAYPGTNLGGQSDYPALAEAAGLGAIGYHGLLTSPVAGARMRLCTIYVGIDNLPKAENPHLWVRDVCANCRRCVRSCPPGAIEPEPKPKANGYKRAIRATACRDYFARNLGCAICLKVCPFSHVGYETVKQSYDATKAKPGPISTLRAQSRDTGGPRVGVIGAGAAGFYLAKALLDRDSSVHVDLIERLPYPHGLVRYGVAPDHPEVRNKGWLFDRMLEHPRLRLLAGVELGKGIDFDAVQKSYDAVALCVGARSSRRMNIPGEDLPGSYSAADFVRWYNAHPDHAALDPRLGKRVAVIGHGNVALDTARMLMSDPEMLVTTDMMPEAAVRFASAQVQEVDIIGRTGPSQTSFTPKELVELSEVPGVQIVIDQGELAEDLATALDEPQAERRRQRNLELFQSWADAPRDLSKRAVRIRFYRDPKEIHGDAYVTGGAFELTRMVKRDGRAVHEGRIQTEALHFDSVLRAIGFQAVPIDGVPFDEVRGRLPIGQKGRVLGRDAAPVPYLYACGWARRGPVGVIGANKTDAEEVADTILSDLADDPNQRCAVGLPEDVAPVKAAEWAEIAREEKRRGAVRGHGPLRFIDPQDAIDWLGSYGHQRLNDPTLPMKDIESGKPDFARINKRFTTEVAR